MLDRPCSGLDPVSTSKIEESLRQLKEKLTIILVPHNVQQAGRVADTAAFLLMGSLIEVGSTTEIFSNPKDKTDQRLYHGEIWLNTDVRIGDVHS